METISFETKPQQAGFIWDLFANAKEVKDYTHLGGVWADALLIYSDGVFYEIFPSTPSNPARLVKNTFLEGNATLTPDEREEAILPFPLAVHQLGWYCAAHEMKYFKLAAEKQADYYTGPLALWEVKNLYKVGAICLVKHRQGWVDQTIKGVGVKRRRVPMTVWAQLQRMEQNRKLNEAHLDQQERQEQIAWAYSADQGTISYPSGEHDYIWPAHLMLYRLAPALQERVSAFINDGYELDFMQYGVVWLQKKAVNAFGMYRDTHMEAYYSVTIDKISVNTHSREVIERGQELKDTGEFDYGGRSCDYNECIVVTFTTYYPYEERSSVNGSYGKIEYHINGEMIV